MIKRTHFLFSLILLLTIYLPLNAQLTVLNTQLAVHDGAVLTIDDLILVESTGTILSEIVNNGEIRTQEVVNKSSLITNNIYLETEKYTAGVSSLILTSNYINNAKTVIYELWHNEEGKLEANAGSKFVFDAVEEVNIYPGNDNYFADVLVNQGDVYFDADFIANNLEFNQGVLYVFDHVTVNGNIIDPSRDSYIAFGTLTRSGTGDTPTPGQEMIFPMGDYAIGYRPLFIRDFGNEVKASVTFTYGETNRVLDSELTAINESITWYVDRDLSVSNVPFSVRIGVDFSEDLYGFDNPVVAYRNSIQNDDLPFISLGGIDNEAPFPLIYFESEQYTLGTGAFTIANTCLKAHLQLACKLEGMLSGLPTNEYIDVLDRLFVQNIALDNGFTDPRAMLPTSALPANVLDVVTIYLREEDTYEIVDSAYAWALTNGDIRDFATGTKPYVSFCGLDEATEYHIQVNHRNHLSLMSSDTWIADTEIPSFTQIDLANPSTLYGIAGAKIEGGEAYMFAGNVTGKDRQINSLDNFFLLNHIITEPLPLARRYNAFDLNFDGLVNFADYDIVSSNSLNLATSTAP